MVEFLNGVYAAFFADPLYFIGIVFAAWAAMGFGLFIAGLIEGLPHLLHYSESDTHMMHSRERITMGLLLTMTAFGAWELVRIVAGQAPWTYIFLSLVMLLPWWWFKLFGKTGAH